MSSAALLRLQIQAALPRFELPLTLVSPPPAELLPVGIAEVDGLLKGGVPRGQMTEIAGEACSGRTTLVQSLLGSATRKGEFCALIDTHDAFDPRSALDAGVDLTQLLWIRCGGHAEHALNAADRIVHAGGFGLVVFDLGDADLQSARRISLASWFRLRHAVEKNPAALVVLTRQFLARSCSKVQLELRRTGTTWSGVLQSIAFQAESRKHQMIRQTQFTAQRFAPLA